MPDKKVDYLEYVYFPDKLTKERQIEIAKGLKAFMETGRYELLPKPDKVNPSGKFKQGNGIRFRKDNPTLIGTHSITEDKLRSAIKMGGLANPSAAIFEMREEMPGDYGEITFVMPSSMVDKKTGRNTGAYAGDAWTPTYPQVERQMGKRGSARAYEDVRSVPKEMQKEVRMGLDSWLDGKEGAGLAYLFLQEEGMAPELSRVAQEYPDEVRNRVSEIAKGEPFYRLSSEQKQQIVDLLIEQYYSGDRAYYSGYLNEKVAMMQEKLADNNIKSFIKKSIQQYIDGVNEYGYDYEAVSDFLNKVQRDIEHSGGVNDRATTQEAARIIREKGLEKDFKKWKEDLVDRYEIKEVIFKGFTPTGNRRYVPHTLENVSKEMKEQGRNGAVGLNATFNKFAAGLLKPLGSLDAIRKRKGNLRATHAETEAFRDKWSEVYYDLAEKLQPDAKGYEDYGLDRVAEAAKKKDPKAFIESEYGIELSEADEKALKDMVWAIQNEYPVMYFETKFERPVYLDEFAGVAVPENVGDDIVEALNNAGVRIETYEPGNEKARMEAVRRLSEDEGIRFRIANRNQEIFVSNARKAVEEIKQEKATPQQWLAMLKKNGGLKAGEDAWMGLSEWLENSESKSLTKQELLDFIDENAIRIEEVEYEAAPNSFESLKEEYEDLVRNEGFDAAQDVMLERFGDDFSIAFDDLGGELVIADEEAASALLGSGNIINSTRLDYTTEGLENKREIALTVPTIEPYNASDEVHFGDAGGGRAVAWVRFGETTDSEGNRVLVIDEIQSKRHQDGREKGYISSRTQELQKERTALYEKMYSDGLSVEEHNRYVELGELLADASLGGVPSAPFEKNWQELAMKRMLRLAAEEGFDKVAWTTGEQQAQRYDMSRQVESIDVEENTVEEFSDGTPVAKNITISTANGMDIRIDTDADGVIHGGEYGGRNIADVVGKELAVKIMQPGNFKLEGEGLRIGGEGMKGFYDRILPSFVGKYTKKWGAKVGTVEMPNLEQNNVMHSVDVTPAMKESVMEGQTMFRFIGERGAANLDRAEEATTRLDNLAIAREMETAGKEAKAIKLATSWERGADGKWRYETGDIKINENAVFRDVVTGEELAFDEKGYMQKDGVVKLGDFVEDKELFEAYPELRDYTVSFKAGTKYSGSYKGTTITIDRGRLGLKKNEDGRSIRSTLAHEIQHAIQSIEGFARGGNKKMDNPVLAAEVEKSEQLLRSSLAKEYKERDELLGQKDKLEEKISEWNKQHPDGVRDEEIDSYNRQYKNLDERINELNESISTDETDLFELSFIDVRLGMEGYKRLAGEVESRNVQERLDYSPEQRRNKLARESAEFEPEEQIFIYEDEENALMGSRVDARMAQVAAELDGRELTDEQRAVADVFGGKKDRLLITIKTKDGATRNIEMQQGNELAGAKHSLYKHFGTSAGVINSVDITLIPEVISNGERTVKGRKAVYKLEKDGVKYTVVTYIKENKEEFKNFYSNKKGQPSQSVNAEIGDTQSARITEELASADKGSDNSSNSQEDSGTRLRISQEELRREVQRVDSEIVSAVNNAAAGLNTGVEIVSDIQDVPDARRRGSKGWFSNGKVYLVLPNAEGVEDAVETVLHEVVGHKGLRRLFGGKFDEMLSEVFGSAPKNVRAEIMRRALELMRRGRKNFLHEATEEYLAEQAERGFEDYSVWDTVKALFHKLMRSIGVRHDISDEEIRYMLWRSYKLMKSGKSFMNEVENINKQEEFGVGEYRMRMRMPLRSEGRGVNAADGVVQLRDAYDATIESSMYQAREALQDSMRSLKVFQDFIEKATGKEIPDWMNAYYLENAMSSANKAEAELFARVYYQKIIQALTELNKEGLEFEEIYDYMMAKHGIERNREMAVREALTGKKGLNRSAYEDWTRRKKEIWAKKLGWEDEQKELDDLARVYGAKEKDYSGLTGMYGLDYRAKAYSAVKAVEGKRGVGELWKAINDATAAILKKQYDTNMMSLEVKNEIEGMYKYYIPLRGFDEKTAGEVYAYMNNSRSPMAKNVKAEGRTSKAENPVAWIAAMAESAIVRGNRNRMKNAFFNLVAMNPNDLVSIDSNVYLEYKNGVWKVATPDIPANATQEQVQQIMAAFEQEMEDKCAKFPDLFKRLKDNPDIPYVVTETSDMMEHQVYVRRNGKLFVMTVNGNPRLAQAVNGYTNPDSELKGAIPVIVEGGKVINRWLSSVYTTRNPDFVVSNFIRDMFYSNTMAWVKESPEYARKFNANYAVSVARIMGLIWKYDRGELDMGKKIEKMFYDFMINGGETGYTNLKQMEQRKKKLLKDLKKKGQKSAVEYVGMYFDEINRSVENAARFAAFMTSREMGRTMARSIWDAKEVSVNFNKKGAVDKMFGATGQTTAGNIAAIVAGLGVANYTFWNAGVQGLNNFATTVAKNPYKGATLITVLTAMGAAAALFNYYDDDEEDSYWMLPSYIRRNNFVFRVTGMKDWITLPLPVEYRAIYGMSNYLTGVITGKEEFDALEFAGLVSQVLPLDMLADGGGLNALVPTWAKPLWQNYTNTNWMGTPIAKKNEFNELDPEYKRVYGNVSAASVELSKFLHVLGGGDTQTRAENDLLFEWNPAMLENLASGYLGGYASLAEKAMKTVEWIAGAREYDNSYILLVNRVLKSSNVNNEARSVKDRYYENLGEIERWEHSMNGWKRDMVDPAKSEEERNEARTEYEKMMRSDDASTYHELKAVRKAVDLFRDLNKVHGNDAFKSKELEMMREYNRIFKERSK